MIEHRPFTALVGADHGWIKARLHFVPPEMGGDPGRSVGPLIAWNDDEIAGRSGFPAHPHKNVEIVTYVRSGAISHKDNLGNAGSAAAGEVQAMSAGIGIEHSEANPGDVPTRLFQIWLKPRTLGGTPRWGTTSLPHDPGEPRFVPLASGDPEDVGALPINADARVLGVRLKAGTTLDHVLRAGGGYLVPTVGRIAVNGVAVGPRDGCLVRDESSLTIDVHEDTEIVFVELT